MRVQSLESNRVQQRQMVIGLKTESGKTELGKSWCHRMQAKLLRLKNVREQHAIINRLKTDVALRAKAFLTEPELREALVEAVHVDFSPHRIVQPEGGFEEIKVLNVVDGGGGQEVTGRR